MGILDQLTDKYNRVARLTPALLLSLPLIVLAILAIPAVVTVWGKLVALLAASGLLFAVSQVVRDRGWRVENALFESWGGMPTTVMLRWSSSTTTAPVRRRHQLIRKHLGIDLPDADRERADPHEADEEYSIATGVLRERTRDSARFPLVLNELTAYGFRRNLYACRPLGVAASLAAIVLTVTLPWLGIISLGWKQQALLAGFDVAWLFACLLLPRPAWVRRAAERYARQLFLSLESFDQPPTPPSNQ